VSVQFWLQKTELTPFPSDYVREEKYFRLFLSIVGSMHKAGVNTLAGTDCPFGPYCFPGFGLHDEMELLVKECHFTPREALQAATINPAKFLGREESIGTIETDKIADLVLLGANPITDIHNTTKIHAVIVNGRLLTRSHLQEMLDEVEATYGKKKDADK
jgi:imidazolonepropionase-like amidohydrolase